MSPQRKELSSDLNERILHRQKNGSKDLAKNYCLDQMKCENVVGLLMLSEISCGMTQRSVDFIHHHRLPVVFSEASCPLLFASICIASRSLLLSVFIAESLID